MNTLIKFAILFFLVSSSFTLTVQAQKNDVNNNQAIGSSDIAVDKSTQQYFNTETSLPSSEIIIDAVQQKWQSQGLNNSFSGAQIDVSSEFHWMLLKVNTGLNNSNSNGLKITEYPYEVGLGIHYNFLTNWDVQGWAGYVRYSYKLQGVGFQDDFEDVNSDGWFSKGQVRIPLINHYLPSEVKLTGGYSQTAHLYGPTVNASFIAYFYHQLGVHIGYEHDNFSTHDEFLPSPTRINQIQLGLVWGE